MMDLGFRIRDLGLLIYDFHMIHKSGHRIGSGHRIAFWMEDLGLVMIDLEYGMRDFGLGMFDLGFAMINFGIWVLGFGMRVWDDG